MSLQAPPGHSAQPAALIAAQLAGLTLNISPPDADLKVGSQPSHADTRLHERQDDAAAVCVPQDATLSIDGAMAQGTSAILKLGEP